MMTLGLGLALGAPMVASTPPGPAANLLLWTEAMDNPVWAPGLVVVTPNAFTSPVPPGDGTLTADQCSFPSAGRTISQTSGTAAGSGTASVTDSLSSSWVRYSITAALDTGTFTLSVWLLKVSGASVTLTLAAGSGFAVASLRSSGGSVILYAWGWQLETGSSATTYVPRTI